MSWENVELVRRAFDAVNRRMVDEALEFIDPDGELALGESARGGPAA